MDNQRTILLVALVLIGFLIWQQWRIDQVQQSAPEQATASASATPTVSGSTDVPEAAPAPSASLAAPAGKAVGAKPWRYRLSGTARTG